jgi:hypothetical protein
MKIRRFSLLLAVLALASSCTKKQPEVEGYRVASYDSTTGKWIIIRNGTFDGKYLRKRITAVCAFYKWGDHEAVAGAQACSLRVGQMLVPNPLPGEGKRGDFMDIWEPSPDTLSITTGDGSDRVLQQFTILKEEVLSD